MRVNHLIYYENAAVSSENVADYDKAFRVKPEPDASFRHRLIIPKFAC